MENQDVFTPTQESWIEGQYSDLSYSLRMGNWAEAETIIKEVRARDFDAQANDMQQMYNHEKHIDR
jgi:hypothetical protein